MTKQCMTLLELGNWPVSCKPYKTPKKCVLFVRENRLLLSTCKNKTSERLCGWPVVTQPAGYGTSFQNDSSLLILLYTPLASQPGRRWRYIVCDKVWVRWYIGHQPIWLFRFKATVLSPSCTLESPGSEIKKLLCLCLTSRDFDLNGLRCSWDKGVV